jgi:hypothetical protein
MPAFIFPLVAPDGRSWVGSGMAVLCASSQKKLSFIHFSRPSRSANIDTIIAYLYRASERRIRIDYFA